MGSRLLRIKNYFVSDTKARLYILGLLTHYPLVRNKFPIKDKEIYLYKIEFYRKHNYIMHKMDKKEQKTPAKRVRKPAQKMVITEVNYIPDIKYDPKEDKRYVVYGNITVYEHGVFKNSDGIVIKEQEKNKTKISVKPPGYSQASCFDRTRTLYTAFYGGKLDRYQDKILFYDESAGLHLTNIYLQRKSERIFTKKIREPKNLSQANIQGYVPEKIFTEVEWKPIIGYENLYLVSTKGHVLSKRTMKLLKQQLSVKKYFTVTLRNNGHQRKLVHVLVCDAFKPDPTKPFVDHLDRNRQNNHINNLRKVSASENAYNKDYRSIESNIINRYSLDGRLMYHNFANNIVNNSFDDGNGQYISEWTTNDLYDYGFNTENIRNLCLGLNGIKTSDGFMWKYRDRYEDISEFKTIISDKGENGSLMSHSRYKINKRGVVINYNNLPLRPAGINRSEVSLIVDQLDENGNVINAEKTRKVIDGLNTNDVEENETITMHIHRLVALTFDLPNSDKQKYTKVMHISDDFTDHSYDNLKWVDQAMLNEKYQAHKVYEVDNFFSRKLVHIFKSKADAEKSLGMEHSGTHFNNLDEIPIKLGERWFMSVDPRNHDIDDHDSQDDIIEEEAEELDEIEREKQYAEFMLTNKVIDQ